MEESKVQALHDTLSKLKKSAGLGVSSHYNFGKVQTKQVDGKTVRADGLPNNPLYFPFVREGTYDKNKADAARYGDGRVIKRNFDDIHSDNSDDSNNERKKSKEERKAEKKAAKLEAKRQAKLEEKRRMKKEEKRLARLNSSGDVSEKLAAERSSAAGDEEKKKRKVSDDDESKSKKKKSKKSKKSKS
jgi:hypothetical protein